MTQEASRRDVALVGVKLESETRSSRAWMWSRVLKKQTGLTAAKTTTMVAQDFYGSRLQFRWLKPSASSRGR